MDVCFVKKQQIVIIILFSCVIEVAVTGNLTPKQISASTPYKIKPGDTLSELLYQHRNNRQLRIYGKGRLLDLLLKKNPQIKNPDVIFPGREIYFFRTTNESHPPKPANQQTSVKIKTLPITNIPATKNQPLKKLSSGISEKSISLEPPAAQTIRPTVAHKPPQENSIQRKKQTLNTRKTDQSQKKSVPPQANNTITSQSDINQDDSLIASHQKSDTDNSNIQTLVSFEVVPTISFMQLKATENADGSRAKLVTKLNYGVDLNYKQHWSPDFSSHLQVGLMQVDYEPLSNKTIYNPSKTSAHFGVGGEYALTKGMSILASVNYAQKPFLRSPSATQINVELVAIPELNFGLSFDLLNKGPFFLGISFEAGYLGSGSTDYYKISSGTSYGVNLNLNYKSDNFFLRADVFGKQETQNTSIVGQDRTEVGVDLGFEWQY